MSQLSLSYTFSGTVLIPKLIRFYDPGTKGFRITVAKKTQLEFRDPDGNLHKYSGSFFYKKNKVRWDNSRISALQTYKKDASQWKLSGIKVQGSRLKPYLAKSQYNKIARYALRGDNFFEGSKGNDVIRGYSGNDELYGGKGADRMLGGKGNDNYNVENVNDTVIEKPKEGVDTIYAYVDFSASKNVENLTLVDDVISSGGKIKVIRAHTNADGNSLDNVLVGSSGNNKLKGKGGNDSLEGLKGGDILTGGPGVDKFIYTSFKDSLPGLSNRDTITDFKGSRGERIDLSEFSSGFKFIGGKKFTGTAGEIRFSNELLQIDRNGNRITDMAIKLTGLDEFEGGFLVL